MLWSPDAKNWLLGKDPDVAKDWRQEEKGTTEDEIVGWHHRLNRREFEQVLGVGDGQGRLACCSPWGLQKVGHDWATELNWTESVYKCVYFAIHLKLTQHCKSTILELKKKEINSSYCHSFKFGTTYTKALSEYSFIKRNPPIICSKNWKEG